MRASHRGGRGRAAAAAAEATVAHTASPVIVGGRNASRTFDTPRQRLGVLLEPFTGLPRPRALRRGDLRRAARALGLNRSRCLRLGQAAQFKCSKFA